ncbi:MAG: hypothetical protein LBQ54_12620 [Planctomycetaceae bacterium]|jgi:hypothetical protein|nr:hypothetical protein [Planctomycetaceae bacterium]
MFSWESLAVVAVLLILISGISRLALKRQTEILKGYFQPEELHEMEQTILKPEKTAGSEPFHQPQAAADSTPSASGENTANHGKSAAQN